MFKLAIKRVENGKWHVYSESGRHMGGPYSSEAEANHRLQQIEYFKRMKKHAAKKQYRYGFSIIHPIAKENEKWEYSIQQHKNQNGTHFDLRMLRPGDDKAVSWAMKKPPFPGLKPSLAMRTHDHTMEHMDFEGPMITRAGHGTVKLLKRGTITVKKIDQEGIHFNMEGVDYRLRPFKGKKYMFEQALY